MTLRDICITRHQYVNLSHLTHLQYYTCCWILHLTIYTGGHRTRVAAVTLDNMAEDAVAASASLRQILTVSVRYSGPALVSWLSMLWDTLMRNCKLQWFDISLQFQLKVSRGDEGVGHVCFPGDEGVGQPWRGYRCVQMNVGPAWYRTAAKLGTVYIFLDTKSHLTFLPYLDMIVWSQLTGLENAFWVQLLWILSL